MSRARVRGGSGVTGATATARRCEGGRRDRCHLTALRGRRLPAVQQGWRHRGLSSPTSCRPFLSCRRRRFRCAIRRAAKPERVLVGRHRRRRARAPLLCACARPYPPPRRPLTPTCFHFRLRGRHYHYRTTRASARARAGDASSVEWASMPATRQMLSASVAGALRGLGKSRACLFCGRWAIRGIYG